MSERIFGDMPASLTDFERAAIVLLPVPYDGTSTWQKGADKGPDAIIEASPNLEMYDIETNSEVFHRGIHVDDPITESSSPEAMTQAVKKRVAELLSLGKFPVVLGGEHTVSLGAIQAQAACYPDIGVLQLDAHTDLRSEYMGSPYNHACVMARAQELCPVYQVGIRSSDSSEKPRIKRNRLFTAKEIVGKTRWSDILLRMLPDRVYITIDVDVLDPSEMPSTGTPEPGGMRWLDVMMILRRVAVNKNVVGFDVVELCPQAGVQWPNFTAAKLVYQMLSYKFGR